jgi:hypothetical protein
MFMGFAKELALEGAEQCDFPLLTTAKGTNGPVDGRTAALGASFVAKLTNDRIGHQL